MSRLLTLLNHSLELTHIVDNEVLSISLSGDLLGLDGERVLIEVVEAQVMRGLKYCIIDVSGVRYMNSMGLSMLVKVLVLIDTNQGDLFVVNPNDQVRRIFTITKLDLVFTVASSVDLALEKIGKEKGK